MKGRPISIFCFNTFLSDFMPLYFLKISISQVSVKLLKITLSKSLLINVFDHNAKIKFKLGYQYYSIHVSRSL
jgi:hypothetical protein